MSSHPSHNASVWDVSPRELQTLRELAAGHTNREIARRMGISEDGVKYHLKNVYGKLCVRGRVQAYLTAASLGLLDSTIQHSPGGRPGDIAPGMMDHRQVPIRA